jgi:tetratricopeptide (TPR) repeat protein
MQRLILRSVAIISTFAALVVCIHAQTTPSTTEITGRVLDVQTGQPVFNISVFCEGSGFNGRVITERNGNFRFSQLVPGHYNVYIHTPGYQDSQQSVDILDSRGNQYLLFRLKEDPGPRPAISATVLDANIPIEARTEFEKAGALIDTGKKEKLTEGAQHLEKAITLYPKFLEAELKLGATYMDLEQWDKAEATLKHTLEINPKAANAMFALGEVYLHIKKEDEAEKILTEGLAVQDASAQGHLTLARTYLDMATKIKDDAKARPLLEKSYAQVRRSLELDPRLAKAHLLKGNLLMLVHRAPDAVGEFEEYLRLEPKGPVSDQTRGRVEKIKKALAEAGNKP